MHTNTHANTRRQRMASTSITTVYYVTARKGNAYTTEHGQEERKNSHMAEILHAVQRHRRNRTLVENQSATENKRGGGVSGRAQIIKRATCSR